MAVVAAFAACDSTDGCGYISETVSDPIQVTEIDRMYNPEGGTKSITFNKAVQRVKCSESWANAVISGNSVAVSVDETSDIYNRHANIIAYAADNDSVIVSITQLGVVFDLGDETEFFVGNSATQKVITPTANSTIVVKSTPDWITPTITDGVITLNIAENTTGKFRLGEVVFISGEQECTISVLQGEIAGTYYFAGTDPSTGSMAYFMSTISFADGNITISFPSYGWTMTMPFDEDNMSFDLPAGTYLGTYGNYHAGIILWDTDLGYISWSSSVTYHCSLEYDEELGTVIGTFEDNGSWSGYTVSGLQFYAFTSETFSSSARKGYIKRMVDPFLQKVD